MHIYYNGQASMLNDLIHQTEWCTGIIPLLYIIFNILENTCKSLMLAPFIIIEFHWQPKVYIIGFLCEASFQRLTSDSMKWFHKRI